jgi:hypothetical protein
MTNHLITLNKAKNIVNEASSTDDLLDIRDKMESLKFHLRQNKESSTLQNQCALISIQAQRKIATVVDWMQENGELAKAGNPQLLHRVTFKLGDININKVYLYRCRKLKS